MYNKDIRDYEVREVYHAVMRKWLREGLSPQESKTRALEAVELRFYISPTYVRNIINRTARITSCLYENMFRERNGQLMELLEDLRDEQKG